MAPLADRIRRDDCRLCGARELELVVPLTPTAMADDYVRHDQLGVEQKTHPIDLWFCPACGHLQLRDVVRAELLFSPEYSFRSGASGAIVAHLREYASNVLAREGPAAGTLVVDVGSNDGTFLRFFGDAGMKVLGIDPATELARRASANGFETWPDFFTSDLARRIRAERGPARLVTANNVFAHADDLGGMADAIRECLAPDGAFVFEVSYVVDVVERMLLGTIFHEHLCYHGVRPLRAFLRRHGLELVDVQRVPVQGGSIIGTAQPIGGPRRVGPVVEELERMEVERGFHRPAVYREFSDRIEKLRGDLQRLLDEALAQGKLLAGFGASRTGTTMLFHFGLGKRLRFLVDDSPAKQGLYSPVDHLPVHPSQALHDRMPDYVFILAWVHARAIMAQHRAYTERGGTFVYIGDGIEVSRASEQRCR